MPQTPKSKDGCVGKDMAGALKGDQDNRGGISANYKGRPGNANPNHPHRPSPQNDKSVSEWTKDKMKEGREKAKEKKANGGA